MSFKPNGWTRAAAAGVLGLVMVSSVATAQDAAVDDTVIVRVNDDDITFGDLDQIRQGMGEQILRLPPDQQYRLLVDIMIDARLMARQAEEDGLADDPQVLRRIENERDAMLRREYLRTTVVDAITDEAVQAAFAAELAAFEPAEERRARHILVETEEEAREIIASLGDGADFSELASEKSRDPGSGRNGGDLGFFGRGMMVAPFEEAAFSLDVGDFTEDPVESQFGWHVIMLDEVRDEPAPTLEAREPTIRQELLRDGLIAASEALREDAVIEYVELGGGAEEESEDESDDAPAGDTPATQE